MFVVSEDEIVQSMRLIWERMKIVIEPSAAVGLAVVLSQQFQEKWLTTKNPEEQEEEEEEKEGKSRPQLQNIGIILCGGNVDLDQLGSIFGRTKENQSSSS